MDNIEEFPLDEITEQDVYIVLTRPKNGSWYPSYGGGDLKGALGYVPYDESIEKKIIKVTLPI